MKLKEHDIEVVKDSVGAPISNHKGQVMGFIAGLVKSNNNDVEFIILGSEHLFGWSTRYFAIPVPVEMVRVVNDIVSITVDIEELREAKRISVKKCPSPLFELEPLIYELTDFPQKKKSTSGLAAD